MKTEILRISDILMDSSKIERAASLLQGGGLVAIPTETVYGLGGDGTRADCARKIYEAKGRPSDNPLILHIATPEDAEKYAFTNEIYYKLAAAFMPGPLTVVLKKKDTVPSDVTGGLDTVAIRCPSHPVAREIIRAAGIPIAAPSANLSGSPSPTSAKHVINDLDGRIDAVVDSGECDIGLESTIVMIMDDGSLTLLRPGAITYDALCCVCERVEIAAAVEQALRENEAPLSPGMKYKHYAPSAPLVLLDGEPCKVLDYLSGEQAARKCAVLCYDEEIPYLEGCILLPVGRAYDTAEHARRLFSLLREADTLNPDVIYGHLPSRDGIGLALYNRMIRAAAHTVKKL